jgi:lipopolysaccharide transport system permease protein
MRDLFAAVWRFRIFIVSSIRGELKGRFARSKLGALWFVLNPLAQAAIFALVLSEMLGARLGVSTSKAAYPVYLMSGMAAWGLFSEITSRCLNIFLEFGPTLKKIAFPRICLPIIVWGGALVNHTLLLAAAFVVFLLLGHQPGWGWLALPIAIVLISMFAFGLGVLLGVFNVFSRDVAQVFSVVLQIWFWLTPVVYTHELVPPGVAWLVAINPMTPLVKFYQDAILNNQIGPLVDLFWPTVFAVGLLVVAFIVFRKASPELVDVL